MESTLESDSESEEEDLAEFVKEVRGGPPAGGKREALLNSMFPQKQNSDVQLASRLQKLRQKS